MLLLNRTTGIAPGSQVIIGSPLLIPRPSGRRRRAVRMSAPIRGGIKPHRGAGSTTPSPTSTPVPPQPISSANAAQVEPLARLGKGAISQIAFSPDGRSLAAASSIGVYLYDAETLDPI